MNSTDGKVLKFLSGLPVIYQDICLVYSPSLKKIAAEGLDRFYQYISLLLIEKPEKTALEDQEVGKLLAQLSDFDYLLLLAKMDKEQEKTIRSAFEFFTGEKVMLIEQPYGVVFGEPSEKRILTKETFMGFQDLVALACAMKDPSEEDIVIFDDDDPKVKEIKMKMLEGRKKRRKAKKSSQNHKGAQIELSDLIASLALDSSLSIINIWDLTYYAFQDQAKRMSWHEEFNINTRASLAGAKLDKDKLSHWIKPMSFSS